MRRIVSLIGIGLATSTALAAVPVSAAGQPDVGFKVPAHAHAGVATTVTWHASGVGSNSVVMQGRNGQTWETFRHLHGAKGTTTIPKEPIGIYDFRIAVYTHAGQLVTARGHKLHVFGKVSWKTLFSKAPQDQSGTYRNFHYVFSFFSNDVNYNALKVSRNPCSSVHISYVAGNDPSNPNESISGEGTVALGRHGRSAIKSTTPAQTVGHLHGSLPVGKTWSVNLYESGTGTRTFTWYFNGTAICDQTQITDMQINQN